MKKEYFSVIMYIAAVLIISVTIINCGKDNKTQDSASKKETKDTSKNLSSSGKNSAGKEIFYMKSKENNAACADCHSDGTNNSNPMTKYFSNIQGANKRTSTYNGKFTGEEVLKNAGGATVCWESYLRMKTPMTEEDIKALNEYYGSVAAADSPTEIKYESIALPVRDKSKLKGVQKLIMENKGDVAKGQADFNNACGLCHGDESKIKKVPSILEDFEGNEKSIIYNVRLGDGGMPFFKSQSLTDQDVADISAYIMSKVPAK